MKLIYLSATNIPAINAQSVQIASMATAFSRIHGLDFKLISPMTKDNNDTNQPYSWVKIKIRARKKFFRHLEFAYHVSGMIGAEQPQFIYTRNIILTLLGLFRNCTTVLEVHSEVINKISRLLLRCLVWQKRFRVVAISQALENYYSDSYGIPSHKILSEHDAVFLERYDKLRAFSKSDLRKEFGFPQDKTIVMHTGSLYADRGAEYFASIIKSFSEIYFVHIGGSHKDVNYWREQYQMYENCCFISHIPSEQIARYQMTADLLFYPITKQVKTWWCASPMKIFEYMATGIPILSKPIGSIAEILNQQNTIILDRLDDNSIISGVEYFIANREQTNTKAQNALRDIRDRYTWERRCKRILEWLTSNQSNIPIESFISD
jgi:glycosyltransferase involved in cell wall biosynthesis